MPKKPKQEKESVTTTVAFDRDTYKRLRFLAVERDTNVRDLIREAVAEWLKRISARGSK
jgi:predicted transcriptional regulator